ncbi:MAG: hypothetical protein ACRDI2_09035, partial [Chloroflexota bacterium]
MARLNLTIPDSLYERLERLRDRVNVSKICAIAVERELDMLEGRTTIADPRIEQLIQRLQSAQERWRQRGREDGTNWAIEQATREELRRVAEEMGSEEGHELLKRVHPRSANPFPPFFPPSFKVDEALDRWVAQDTGTRDQDVPFLQSAAENTQCKRARAEAD